MLTATGGVFGDFPLPYNPTPLPARFYLYGLNAEKKLFTRNRFAISFRVVFDLQIRADFLFCGLLFPVFFVLP
jgi:hypothetical protein